MDRQRMSRRSWPSVSFSDVTGFLTGQVLLRHRTDLGSRVRVHGRPIVRADGLLSIDDRTQIYSLQARTELVVDSGAVLRIGASCLLMDGVTIGATESVTIGDRVLMGRRVSIIDNAFHELAVARRLERPPSRPVAIGDDVWLGTGVIVLPGVSIGTGSIVGAGAVVTTDVAPNTIVAGVPAAPIGRVPPT